jgi:AraC family transcriptional regulator
MIANATTATPDLAGAGRASAQAVVDLSVLIARMRDDPAAVFHTGNTAAAFGLSPFMFIRAFKRLTGLSPQRFHAALRIAHAKCLLVETDRSVTEISLDAGYDSLGTFVRTFSALVGISPGQLRRLSRGETDVLGDPIAPVRGFHDGPQLQVALQTPLPPGALVAAGLFPQGLPAGLPFHGCFVDPDEPRFTLNWPPGRRRASLLIVAVGPFDARSAWAGRLEDVQVCGLAMTRLTAGPALLNLSLRPLASTDPPLLTPIPLLMLLQASLGVAPGRPVGAGKASIRQNGSAISESFRRSAMLGA